MNRRFSWRLRYPCLVASALFALEGVSFAEERGFPPAAPNATNALGREPHSFVQAVEAVLVLMPVCHISRHPLDGLRASEHACPLLFADAVGPEREKRVVLPQGAKPSLFFMSYGRNDAAYLRFYYVASA